MYGMIARITAAHGKRDALIAVLTRNGSMPGCLSYVVARDTATSDALLVTEVWETKDLHDNSLAIPAVKAAIAEGRPLIAGFDVLAITEPVGGIGIPESN